MVGGAIRSKLIHRMSYRASVLHQLWTKRGEKNTAREFSVLTTPSLLSRGTLKFICPRTNNLKLKTQNSKLRCATPVRLCLGISFCGRGGSALGRGQRLFGSCSSGAPGVCGG